MRKTSRPARPSPLQSPSPEQFFLAGRSSCATDEAAVPRGAHAGLDGLTEHVCCRRIRRGRVAFGRAGVLVSSKPEIFPRHALHGRRLGRHHRNHSRQTHHGGGEAYPQSPHDRLPPFLWRNRSGSTSPGGSEFVLSFWIERARTQIQAASGRDRITLIRRTRKIPACRSARHRPGPKTQSARNIVQVSFRDGAEPCVLLAFEHAVDVSGQKLVGCPGKEVVDHDPEQQRHLREDGRKEDAGDPA